MNSTYPDLDPYFVLISDGESIVQCALRACEEILFDRTDDKAKPGHEEERTCEQEIETDERVKQARVTIDGNTLSVVIDTTSGDSLQLQGLLDDDKIDIIVGSHGAI